MRFRSGTARPLGVFTVYETHPSLLNRLRDNPEDPAAWNRFDTVYRPLLAEWLRRYTLQAHDADDLVQNIFQILVREVPRFNYDPARGRFRGWLRGILVNQLRDFSRRQRTQPVGTGDSDFLHQVLNQLEDPASDLARDWDREHDQHVSRHLLRVIADDFAPTTWAAFERVMVGEAPATVADSLGISVNAVYLAKSSILKRLREEIARWAD